MNRIISKSDKLINLYKVLLIVCLSNFIFSCSPSKSEQQKLTQRPNVVFIYADDMGYGEINALNPDRSKIPTPHLNKLAADGMVFTDAHTTSSVCTPSRYGLLTGRYNWRSRLQEGVVTGGHVPLIAADRYTLPELFKGQGYSTAIVGKWHLEYIYEVPDRLKEAKLTVGNDNLMPAPYPIGTRIVEGPITRGFETFYGFHHSREMSSIVRNDVIEKEIKITEVLTSLTDEVVDLIDNKAAKAKEGDPFFIYFAQNSPHTPIAPSEPWQGKTALGAYGDFVAETDGSVGAVMDAIERNGLTDNTIVIFSSDNGTSRAADIPYLQSNGHYPSADFRGYKTDLWDGGHRVPFIVRWPGVTQPGSKNNQLVSMADWFSTFADLLDKDLPDNAAEDSWSFLNSLSGNSIDEPRKSIVYHSLYGRFSVRSDDWKLVLAPGSGGWTVPDDVFATEEGLPPYQLYNLREDIGEQENLSDLYPDKVEELTALLKDMVKRGRTTPGKVQKNDADIDIYKKYKNLENDSPYK